MHNTTYFSYTQSFEEAVLKPIVTACRGKNAFQAQWNTILVSVPPQNYIKDCEIVALIDSTGICIGW
jgi:hypothetical protein